VEHAEAHELLSDLALEPRRLAALPGDPSPEARALRAHLADCDQCATDLAGWQRTWSEIGRVIETDGVTDQPRAGQPEPGSGTELGTGALIRPPVDLRQRVMAAAGPGVSIAPLPAPRTPRRFARPWLVTAAAVLIAAITATSSYLRTTELERLHAETTQLAVAAAALDRVLAADRHWTVTLRTADGTPGGTLAWSPTELVVLTSGLPAPGAGQGYRCWLERAGSRSAMGWIAFSRSTGFWAGSMSEYPDGALRPGARFGVSLVPAGGGGTPVLVGEL